MKRIIFLLVLLTLLFVLSCGGGSSGGLQAPTYNMSGTWTVTDTPQTDTCQSVLDQPSSFTATITHAQGSNSMTMTDTSTSDSYDLTVSGTSITYSGTESNVGSCSSLSQSWEFTAYSESAISGTVSWTCKYPGGSCIGTSSVDAIKAAPTISGFNPTSGPVGTTVTITGANFSATAANNTVKFHGTTALVSNSTATTITTSVPTGATTGTISVIVSGQTATSVATFTVTGGGPAASPTIASFNPTSGPIGTTVTITGTGFSATAASNTVKFHGTTATVTNSTTTSITTSVPNGATTGTISVTVSGQTATSVASFTVTGGGGGGTSEVEPNGSYLDAQVISVNETINATTSGNYNAGTSDRDWYKITLTPGNYTIRITFGSTGDLALYLLNSSLAQLNYIDTQAYGGTETITHFVNTTGTYYVAVVPWDCTTTTSYTLIVLQQ